jgi:hypothetical protein
LMENTDGIEYLTDTEVDGRIILNCSLKSFDRKLSKGLICPCVIHAPPTFKEIRSFMGNIATSKILSTFIEVNSSPTDNR